MTDFQVLLAIESIGPLVLGLFLVAIRSLSNGRLQVGRFELGLIGCGVILFILGVR